MRIAIDTGGTFTDCVYFADGELHVLKLFSTPADPAFAVLEALKRIAGAEIVEVRHGTTVATNAMLERKGALVAFVTTAGFEDTIAPLIAAEKYIVFCTSPSTRAYNITSMLSSIQPSDAASSARL